MAKIVTIELRAQTKDAQTELERITQEILEQKELTIELQKELLQLEEKLKRTPKNAYGAQRRLKKQIDDLKISIKDNNLGLKELNLNRTKAAKTAKTLTTGTKNLTDQVSKNYGITGLLNTLTGGLASRYRDSYDAVTGLNKGLKGLRGALLATGIGAAVVAVGLLAKNWDKVKMAIAGTTAEQKKFNETQAEANVAANEASKSLRTLRDLVLDETVSQEARNQALSDLSETVTELNGVTLDQEDALKKVTEATDPYIKAVEARAKAEAFAKIIAEEEANIIREQQKDLTEQISTFDVLKVALTSFGNAASASGKLAKTAFENQQESINKSKDLISELQTQYQGFITTALEFENQTDTSEKKAEERSKSAIKRTKDEQKAKDQAAKDLENLINQVSAIEDENLNRTIEREQLEKNAVLDKFFTLIEAAKKNNIDTTILEEEKQAQLTDIENKYADIRKKRRDEDTKDAEKAEQAKLNMAKSTLGNISKAVGENTKAGKAAAAAAALINTYQGITAELATKTATPFGFALKLANIAATASIGFKAVKDIMKTEPKSTAGGDTTAPTATGGRPAAEPLPPAFNIVGASGTNQLAEAIGGQTQQPVKAYVVSNDVTTAQELDRNIVKGASLG